MRIYIRRSPLTATLAASIVAFIVFTAMERSSTASTAGAKIEKQQAIPCVFDNFVWFSDQEIMAEIRRALPSFDGSAPESGDTTDRILGALKRMLETRNLPSEVEYSFFSGDGVQYGPAHIFTVRYAKLPVCKIVFQNSPPQLESELQQAAKALVNRNYSKVITGRFVEGRAIQIYRKYGYLRAAARIESAKIDPACENRVVVQVAVEPGGEYVWDKAVWTGAKAVSVQSLDSAIALKPGDMVNGLKIDAGLRAVYIAYQKLGYVEAQILPKPVFDDANRRITLEVAITEGAQFRMGNFIIKGVPEKDVPRLKERWTLKKGDIYDGSYLGEFINKLVADKLIYPDLAKLLTTEQKPDRQRLVIDVIIDFKVSPS